MSISVNSSCNDTTMATNHRNHLSSLGTSPSERIPAWKRLGLQLKYAKEEDNVAKSPDIDSIIVTSQKRAQISPGDDQIIAAPITKKRRVESPSLTSGQVNGKSATSSKPSIAQRGVRLKKSVSFTPETKVEDGDSSKTLHAAWEESDADYYERKAAEHDAAEAAEASQSVKFISQSLDSPTKLEDQSQRVSDAPRKSRDALDYLDSYHKSRGLWKFQKNREVWILRHILSTEAIPSTFNIPLASYIHGLKSERAKSRVLVECQEDLEKDGPDRDSEEDHMEDPRRRKAYQEDAIFRFKRSLEEFVDDEQRRADEEDPEYQRWLSRRRRAELVLWAVTPTSSTERSSVSSQDRSIQLPSSTTSRPTNGVLVQGQVKKKKNRTAVVEQSSDSEEDSDNSDGEDGGGAITNGVLHHADDETSSSDESSTVDSDIDSESASGPTSTLAAKSSTALSSSSDSEPNTHHQSGKRQRSAISISSRSDRSVSAASLTSDKEDVISSISREEDEDDGSESDSSSSGTIMDANHSSMNDVSDSSGDTDEEID